MKKNVFVVWLALVFLTVPAISSGGIPTVSEVTVTDVTPVSFSVVWVVSEPSNVSVNVFHAPECTNPVSGILVSALSVDSTGVSKATVTGLIPATAYCYQTVTTSKSTPDTTLSPATPQQFRTESEIVRTYMQGTDILPFGNDLIHHPGYRFDQTSGTGDILLVSIAGSSTPLSAWLGEGITVPDALIDLNNVFGASTRENMNLIGEERMKLLEVRGADGCTLDRWRKVPIDYGLVEVKNPGACFMGDDLDCNDTVNILDILRDIGGFNTSVGTFCFNSDLDVNGNGAVNILDILQVIGKFGAVK